MNCGFNDMLLLLSAKINQQRLSNTLQTVTDECLNSQKKTVNSYISFSKTIY